VLTEVTAGKGGDVFSSAPATPYLFIRAGAAAQTLLINDNNLAPALRDPLGYRHPYAQNIQVILSNPNLASYIPTDIFELSKPAYKGQMVMDSPDNLGVGALFLASHRKAWGDKKWFQWLQGLKDNNIFIVSSATSAYQAALTGERGIAIDTIGDFLSAPAGAPLKATFYTGAAPYVQAFMKTSYAAHPYTADLFINWVLSKEGQNAIVSTNRTPSVDIPGAKTSVSTLVPKAKPIAPYSSIAGFVYNPLPYVAIWDKLWPS
jgi:ABC-type Fe3+ transport system substrate-binding protein